MKLLIQRTRGPVGIVCSRDGTRTSEGQFDGAGLVVLMGWEQADASPDSLKQEEWLIQRAEGLRVFPDAQGKLNLNLADYMTLTRSEGGILWVSQFTLAAKLESGFRPSFSAALEPDLARARYESFVARQKSQTRSYRQMFGEFAADMDLSFTNWGPVTIPL